PSVEIMVSAEHKHDFVASDSAESLISATDGAVQKIEQQLRKYKEKVQQKHRNSQQRRVEVAAESSELSVETDD
ncbi:MAG: HPF/RaiA family ribosome-associated protein, partial [Planctomycetota bacterium]